jgi:PhzF family phenazine biosynthesis protein
VRIPLFYIDAFANRLVTGNPAAVCFLSSWLDDELLRKVAAENNLSATAFLVPEREDYQLRWFNPRLEISLCGHATLASAHLLLNVLQPTLGSVQFATRYGGRLRVEKEGSLVRMDFPAFQAKACSVMPDGLIEALGASALPAEVLEVNQTYLVRFDTPDTVCNLRPDLSRLEQLHPYALTVTAPGQETDFVSRYFAPSYGVGEDPVTGSAHCSLTPYWAQRLGKTKLHARQLSARGGELWCELDGTRVILKGQARLTMQGSLTI